MIPVWLLDVDGVINVTPQSGRGSQWPRNQWTKRRVRSIGTQWTVTIADAVLDFQRRADASGRVGDPMAHHVAARRAQAQSSLRAARVSGSVCARVRDAPHGVDRGHSRLVEVPGRAAGRGEGEQATDLDRR